MQSLKPCLDYNLAMKKRYGIWNNSINSNYQKQFEVVLNLAVFQILDCV